MEQAYQATFDRPTKLQLAKITIFGKRRLAKRLTPPRRPEEIQRPKINTLFLTTSPRKLSKDFSKFCLYFEKIDFEGGLG